MLKTNFHTHTARCNHAVGQDEEYITSAIAAGYKVLGMSDHCPYNYKNGHIGPYRMKMEELDQYISSFEQLREKYKDQIELHIGLETEPLKGYEEDIRYLKSKTEYLLLAPHGNESEKGNIFAGLYTKKEQLIRYTDFLLNGIDMGFFSCIAHPDLSMGAYPVFDDTAQWMSKEICRAANQAHLPLEYNLLGMEKQRLNPLGLGYPCKEFWEIAAEENVTAIIGVDAHDPKFLATDFYDQAADNLKKLGIRRIDRFDFK